MVWWWCAWKGANSEHWHSDSYQTSQPSDMWPSSLWPGQCPTPCLNNSRCSAMLNHGYSFCSRGNNEHPEGQYPLFPINRAVRQAQFHCPWHSITMKLYISWKDLQIVYKYRPSHHANYLPLSSPQPTTSQSQHPTTTQQPPTTTFTLRFYKVWTGYSSRLRFSSLNFSLRLSPRFLLATFPGRCRWYFDISGCVGRKLSKRYLPCLAFATCFSSPVCTCATSFQYDTLHWMYLIGDICPVTSVMAVTFARWHLHLGDICLFI